MFRKTLLATAVAAVAGLGGAGAAQAAQACYVTTDPCPTASKVPSPTAIAINDTSPTGNDIAFTAGTGYAGAADELFGSGTISTSGGTVTASITSITPYDPSRPGGGAPGTFAGATATYAMGIAPSTTTTITSSTPGTATITGISAAMEAHFGTTLAGANMCPPTTYNQSAATSGTYSGNTGVFTGIAMTRSGTNSCPASATITRLAGSVTDATTGQPIYITAS